jgi:preprotein translocase subunit SecA
MKFDVESLVQRDHYFAIIDEVDSILIDEARTPLIISGASDEATDKYYVANQIIPNFEKGHKDEETKVTTGDYLLDEKNHSAVLTEAGVTKAEKLLGVSNLYDPGNMELLHCVEQALKAHTLYKRDHHYVVQEGEVIIVDDFTGRLMEGRRWSDGLHQAVEAKEGVKIERENQTLATITLQNYFRMYEKLSGMTGTAETEAEEFGTVYGLDVVIIPTNRAMIREDNSDMIYRTLPEKWDAVVDEIKQLHAKGQPVLVGTVSVENSELVADKLKKIGIPHNVLNAKYHEREAEIVAQAGRKGAVTIATNMAGRGTDILLGGNPEFLANDYLKRMEINPEEATPEQFEEQLEKAKRVVAEEHKEVVAAGGLHILGTERHESRRIDNQLRGRAGRQGDPGASRFFLSLQDDLLRIFGGEKIQGLMLRLGMEEDVPIESKLITRRIAAAQKAVEAQNFAARKHLLEYDDVMNKQRQAVYGMRRKLLMGGEQKDRIRDIVNGIVGSFIDARIPEGSQPHTWDFDGLAADVLTQFGVTLDVAAITDLSREEVEEHVQDAAMRKYAEKEAMLGHNGAEILRETERMVMLNVIDNQWKDHLLSMDHLKEGIGLRGYGQKDPLVEYKKESFKMFQDMMDRIEDETVRFLFFMQPYEEHRHAGPYPEIEEFDEDETASQTHNGASNGAGDPKAAQAFEDFTRNIQRKKEKELADIQFVGGDGSSSGEQQPVIKGPKTGRNDPCPCGSGKKYKKCHGVTA